jgi:hypothetical protein
MKLALCALLIFSACTASEPPTVSQEAAVTVAVDETSDMRPTIGSLCYQGCWHESISCSGGCMAIEDRAAEDRCDMACDDNHIDCRFGCHVLFGDGLTAAPEAEATAKVAPAADGDEADMQQTGCHLDCFHASQRASDRCDNRYFYIGLSEQWQQCLAVVYDDHAECDDWCRAYPFPTGQI